MINDTVYGIAFAVAPLDLLNKRLMGSANECSFKWLRGIDHKWFNGIWQWYCSERQMWNMKHVQIIINASEHFKVNHRHYNHEVTNNYDPSTYQSLCDLWIHIQQ